MVKTMAARRAGLSRVSKGWIALAIVIALLGGTPALAQGPTATPTPNPNATWTPYPAPTGQYSDFRITPTPWAITSVPFQGFDFATKAPEFADTVINTYRWINALGWLDWIIFILIGLGTLMLIANFITQLRAED